MPPEKKILTEFLQLYQDNPCLWDNRQVIYANREARDNAYEILLAKFSEVHEDATMQDVRKKIEYMRATYRREHKKVLLSRLNGDVEEYVPQLWYYDHMTFLNEVADFSRLAVIPRDNGDISLKSEHEEPRPKAKRRKVSTVYLPERSDSNDEDDLFLHHQDSVRGMQDDDQCVSIQQQQTNDVNEAESFGSTIGMQLKQLNPIQRVVAEKLISDVIFHARLDRLTVDSVVSP